MYMYIYLYIKSNIYIYIYIYIFTIDCFWPGNIKNHSLLSILKVAARKNILKKRWQPEGHK